MPIFERFARLLQRHRIIATILFAAVSAVVISFAVRVRTDFTVQELFAGKDPELVFLERFRAQYGADDDLVLLVVEAGDVFEPAVLRHIDALTRALGKLKVIRRVDGLTTISDLGAPGSGAIDTRPVLNELPKTAEQAKQAKGRILQSPLLVGRVVSKDATLATVGCRLAAGMVRAKQMETAVEKIEAVLQRIAAPAGVRRHLVGVPVVRTNLVRMLRVDQGRFIPLSSVITALILLLLYRSFHGMAIPLAAIGLSVNYTVGVMRMFGVPLDILSNILPVLVMVYGIADAVHMINRYHEECTERGQRDVALRMMVRHMGLACLLTSLTTAIGFGSLASSKLAILQRFGLFAALGVMLAYVLSMIVVPLGLEWFGRGKLRPAPAATVGGVLDRLLCWIDARVQSRPRSTFAAALLIALCFAAAGSRVHVDNYLLGTMKADHPVAKATRLLGARLQGVVGMQVAVEGKKGDLKRPKVLQAMLALQTWLEAQKDITGTLSPLNFLTELHRAAVGTRKLPDSQPAIAQLLLMTEGQSGIERYVSFDYSRGRIHVSMRDIGARRYLPFVERTRAEIARIFSGLNVQVHVTGTSLLAYRGINTLVWNLLTSLLIAFCLIAPILMISFRSIRVGLITLIPNVLPLTVGLGFMVLAGMHLDVTTVMIYSIAFGIAVDDTIHFVARYREEVEGGRTVREAVHKTMRSAGRAMLITSLILMTGFAVVLVSNFPGTQRFGILGVVIIGAAVLTDLTVTPACMLIFRPWAQSEAGKESGDKGGAA